jgi:hypothetical protein
MTITAIHYTCKCRRCSANFALVCDEVPTTEGLGIELSLHQHLEEAGWINGLCPECCHFEYNNL